MLFVGTRPVFEEETVSTKFETAVSGSPIVNGSAPVLELMRMV